MVAAVAIGGALGTMGRYELALAEPVASGRFPWATLIANLVGSFVLGVAVTAWPETRGARAVVRAFVAVGICGGLTTFSTWMVESERLGEGGAVLMLLANLAVSALVGFGAAAVGWTIGSALT
jgi:CrcB protein